MIDWLELIALVIGGFCAGLINVIAGNGSAITLPLLMWVGLDANSANATNRVGAVFQTTSAISSLPKTKRVRYMIKQNISLFLQLLSELFSGANLAVDIPETLMRATIGTIMIRAA